LPGTPAEQPVATDDLSSRLPGKYRRAYCFLIENLERPDLAVHEVATHISVTERALQAAFRTYLGISPSELIRTRRMERIRHELLDDDSCAEGKVLRVANRWGVQHRSTLLNGYRKLYHEAPSDTMSR
jgi:transcriptional regulator GlxA family with amidase domain